VLGEGTSALPALKTANGRNDVLQFLLGIKAPAAIPVLHLCKEKFQVLAAAGPTLFFCRQGIEQAGTLLFLLQPNL
jgi:hypothetical protein